MDYRVDAFDAHKDSQAELERVGFDFENGFAVGDE
jgi:hypothetical protein